MKSAARILIVEDERIVAFNLQQRLAHMGYDVPAVAASGSESLAMVQEMQPDLVLMDIHIEGSMDGIEVASELKKNHSVPVIYLTAYSEDATLERARQTRPYGYLIKPFSERELHATIQMALERHSVEEALVRSQRQLQQALEAASMGVMEMDTHSAQITSTARTDALLGWPGDRPVTLDDLLACVDESDRALLAARFQESLSDLRAISEEFRVKTENPAARWIKLDAGHWPDRRMTGVLQDVSARKASEIRLQMLNDGLESLVNERTAELKLSIKELEAFSYSVAHDLRSPIRAIVGFSMELLRTHPDHLGQDGMALVDRIAGAGRRMGALIDALLNMSRLNQVNLRLSPVDLSAMASDIIAQLMQAEPQRVAQVRIAPGLNAMADAVLVHSLLDNLLRNAWKFSAHTALTSIEVGQETQNGSPVFFVRDNGCGFDMAFASRLFGPFQRLHQEQQYPGTGIGLTIVQRIVMRHGGRVWVEAAPDQGATFYFTLNE
jgi:signal transduction histidine kinase